eukprot:4119674-Amphidinium_carterae.1
MVTSHDLKVDLTSHVAVESFMKSDKHHKNWGAERVPSLSAMSGVEQSQSLRFGRDDRTLTELEPSSADSSLDGCDIVARVEALFSVVKLLS